MPQVENRLTIVETALAEFIIQSNKSLYRLGREITDFKDGMEDFKDEMKDFKDRVTLFMDGTEVFRNEMKDFKDEMKEDRREMNKQWGALSNKMGTLVEDIIAPAVRPAVRKYFGEEVLDIMVNRKKYDKGQKLRGEFDVIAVTATSVYLVDTKVSPDKDKLLEFKNKVAPRFRKLFPEYGKLQLVLLFASLWFDKKLVDFATKEKIYILAYREWDYMDILNFEDLKAG
ncbi:MAG: hypothetical protein KDD10_02880 [Phaeodactylibacter sp.]|nr:hypothetical protein [Phaeodactylibacter sp.]